MYHEKEIKRPDGTKYRIRVSVYITSTTVDGGNWSADVSMCLPRKRTWKPVADTNDYGYRRLDYPERQDWIRYEIRKHLTDEEVLNAKMELWQKFKPT